MGLDKFLIGLPIAIMIFAIFIASSTANALQNKPGQNVKFCNQGINCDLGSNVQSFAFGSITTNSFIQMIEIAVGVAAIAGITILGSGESPETVHIIFMSSLVLGLWLILSLAEGFVSSSPASVFSSLDRAISGLGTSIYLILTITYMIGGIAAISRGGTS